MYKNIALLIDGENISGQKIDLVFEKIKILGTITTKRIYGDFTKSHLSSWESYILKYAIEKKHQTSYSAGKNSSDIALAIDAMDLLNNKKCDAFCIVSSDSDFIGLAMRIRRDNITVFGFGNQNTIKEFRQVCSEFFEIPSATNTSNSQNKKYPINTYTANQLKCDTKLLNALRNSISYNKADKHGWVNYAIFSSYLQDNYKDIIPENYGYHKIYEILDKIDLFEVKKENSTIFIRITPTKNKQAETNQQWSSEQLKKNANLINALKDGVTKNLENGWANFSQFSQHINNHYPNIKPNNYGYGKWRSLINQIDLFETKQADKTTLLIREKNNGKTSNIAMIQNKKLLNDLLEIINENNLRKSEWVHIGYLGSQLKNKGYNPKDFGVKTFGLLLKNTQGVETGKGNYLNYFTLANKSQIKPI